MNECKKMSYEAPVVKVIVVEIEKGFGVSGTGSVSGWTDGGEYEDSFTL